MHEIISNSNFIKHKSFLNIICTMQKSSILNYHFFMIVGIVYYNKIITSPIILYTYSPIQFIILMILNDN